MTPFGLYDFVFIWLYVFYLVLIHKTFASEVE
jgi:hypothetical protein